MTLLPTKDRERLHRAHWHVDISYVLGASSTGVTSRHSLIKAHVPAKATSRAKLKVKAVSPSVVAIQFSYSSSEHGRITQWAPMGNTPGSGLSVVCSVLLAHGCYSCPSSPAGPASAFSAVQQPETNTRALPAMDSVFPAVVHGTPIALWGLA